MELKKYKANVIVDFGKNITKFEVEIEAFNEEKAKIYALEYFLDNYSIYVDLIKEK